MKFGQVPDPDVIDFSIPSDHADTKKILKSAKGSELKIHVGCAKWNKTDLKGFYPKGVKDELGYYSTQFNCIELNATFYRLFPATTFEKWHETVPESFKFFPKFEQSISHFKRLKDVEEVVDLNVERFSLLQEKLGMPFLQLHNNFAPKDIDRVKAFIDRWNYDIPFAVEFRHADWFADQAIADEINKLLTERGLTSVLVDTAGRRDMMHMRLTSPRTFIRYVGANHPSDYTRLEAWVERIAEWKKQGLQELNFFVHQNVEKESPLLSAHFIKLLNKKLGTDLQVPKTLSDESNGLFG